MSNSYLHFAWNNLVSSLFFLQDFTERCYAGGVETNLKYVIYKLKYAARHDDSEGVHRID
ncbi:hypothetical protein AWB85_19150 [Mycobacteroides immunogenum]|uniref:Uncharacterized protein n=1 Tax=Mycobacteroides immunogenum TaxID=83262 RepID=A0A179VDP2_9MYCO|nr:hypothetical protein AWB85_19150 [Mycobacteroides immunogenum]